MTERKYDIAEFDIIFLSYDEPNAEANWAHLSNLAPWAKRVHGVKGFDAAHKACADLAETERFITVDGDNVVDEAFFNVRLTIDEETEGNHVFSWAGRNMINGLVYGNGGLKLWTRKMIRGLRSHEAATTQGSKVDFCWDLNYKHLNNSYSQVWSNATPFQAYRAGFREGVKMTLDRGLKVPAPKLKELIHPKNYKRLLIWMTIGADVDNGQWAIYGARSGCWLTNGTDWDYTQISSYDWFEKHWNKDVKSLIDTDEKLLYHSHQLQEWIRNNLHLEIADFSSESSAFFKTVYEPPPRIGAMVKEDDF